MGTCSKSSPVSSSSCGSIVLQVYESLETKTRVPEFRTFYPCHLAVYIRHFTSVNRSSQNVWDSFDTVYRTSKVSTLSRIVWIQGAFSLVLEISRIPRLEGAIPLPSDSRVDSSPLFGQDFTLEVFANPVSRFW